MKRYIAEFIGTFTLIFCGTGAMTINEVTGGEVTHVGIGITWGFVVIAKKFAWKEVPKYIVAQVLGAFAASLILLALFPDSELLGSTIPKVDVWRAFVLELLLTFFLMVTIINVSTGSKEIGTTAAIAIGGVVMIEALFAGPITNASMNPARSLAPNIISGNIQHLWLYMVAPVLGALLAVVSCKLVKDEQCCEEEC